MRREAWSRCRSPRAPRRSGAAELLPPRPTHRWRSYNVAGLAQLRGTQVLVDGQLLLPNEGQPCLDYQRQRQRPCYGGLVAASTDFGVLRRWTFGLGFRLPALVTGYGLNLPGTLDPGGAALLWPRALLFAPSLAVGVQAHPRLAVGLAVEDAMGLSLIPCPTTTSSLVAAGCSRAQVGAQSLWNPVVQLGLLGHLGTATSTVLLAASLRSAPNLGREPIFSGTQRISLPWTARAGARYLYRRRDTGQSVADVELDGVAQLWMPDDIEPGSAQTRSSLGLRLGASYHAALRRAVFVGRAGLFFDGWLARPAQSASEAPSVPVDYATNRLRVYVLGGTVGVGVQSRYLDVDLAYGYQSQLSRLPAGVPESARPAAPRRESPDVTQPPSASGRGGRGRTRPGPARHLPPAGDDRWMTALAELDEHRRFGDRSGENHLFWARGSASSIFSPVYAGCPRQPAARKSRSPSTYTQKMDDSRMTHPSYRVGSSAGP